MEWQVGGERVVTAAQVLHKACPAAILERTLGVESALRP